MNPCKVCKNPCANQTLLVQSQPKKTVIVFLGWAGCGKTTQIELLKNSLKCEVYHMGRFASKIGAVKRADGGLIEGLDNLFISHIESDVNEFCILDGFPRSVEQLLLIKKVAAEKAWNIIYFHLAFPKGQESEISMQRQTSRAGLEKADARILGKIDRCAEKDMSVINALQGQENYFEFSALQSIEIIEKQVADTLLLSFFNNDFAQKIMLLVSGASGIIKKPIYLLRSFIYTQVWANRFGAIAEPNDIDVMCPTATDNDIVYMSETLTFRRFEVKKSLKNGIETVEQSLDVETLPFYKLAFKIEKTGVSILGTPKDIFQTIIGDIQSTDEKFETKIKVNYPRLGQKADLDWFEDRDKVVRLKEKAQCPPNWEIPENTDGVAKLALAYEKANKQAIAPKRWGKTPLKLADFETAARTFTDNEFREWLLNQVNSRKPLGGKDKTVQAAFAFMQNGKKYQKDTHQGRVLNQHLVECALQLQTDNVSPEAKVSLRTAAMFHDIGKSIAPNISGTHQGLGAKLFKGVDLPFLTASEKTLALYLITWHDLFGRMIRGCVDLDKNQHPKYFGALPISRVKNIVESCPISGNFEDKLEVHLSIWKADIRSVASLSWVEQLLPSIRFLFL